MKAARRRYRRHINRSIAALAGALLLCCAAGSTKEAAARKSGVPDPIVTLDGNMDEAMVDLFNKAVSQRRITTVLISSQGGSEVEGLQIAEAVLARNMDVVVRGLCVGPCAQLVFVAGRHRRIEGEALVLFTSTAAGMAALFAKAGEDIPPDFQPNPKWRDFAAREELLYQRAGVSKSLLLDMQLAQQPRCLIFNRRAGKADRTSLSKTYAMWMPTRKQLAAVGLTFEGSWPTTRDEMLRVGERYLKSRERPGQEKLVRFGDDDNMRRPGEVKYTFKQLQGCLLEQVGPPPTDGVPAGD